MCWEKQVRPLTENTRGPIHFLGYQKPGGWNNRNVLSQVLEAICPGSRNPWGWFLLRVEREGCVPCSLLASGGSPAILGILWLVEASLHLCPNLQVFSLDVHLYLNFLVFIGTVVLPDSVQFSLLTQSCPTLCDPMDCCMPGLPVQHQLLEFTQTHVHQVSDAIQPSHPLSSLLLLPSIFPSIRVFSNESALGIRWPKYWSFSLNISPSNEQTPLFIFGDLINQLFEAIEIDLQCLLRGW